MNDASQPVRRYFVGSISHDDLAELDYWTASDDFKKHVPDIDEEFVSATAYDALARTVEELRKRLVSAAYVDVVPYFQQGEADHEVLEDVTAEDCKGWVAEIQKLQSELDATKLLLKAAFEAKNMMMDERDQAQAELREARAALEDARAIADEHRDYGEYPEQFREIRDVCDAAIKGSKP